MIHAFCSYFFLITRCQQMAEEVAAEEKYDSGYPA
jgi:hypothetical protein